MEEKAKKKPRYSVVDDETGEVIDHLFKAPAKKQESESYLKVFYRSALFRDDLSHSTKALLFALAAKMPYSNAGFPLHLSTYAKKQIEKEFGISIPSINRGLTELLNKKCIYRVERGEYLVNPYMFGKGPTAAIKERQKEWDILISQKAENVSTGRETAAEKENTPA